MKVVFLSQYFMPEPGATSELLSGIAIELAKRPGMDVQAIAGQPSYFGASKIDPVFTSGGVTVHRIWSTQLNKNTTLGRVANSATFSLSCLWSLLTRFRSSVVIPVTNPPLLMWICGIANLIAGMRYVVLIHDVYPDIAVELGALRRGGLVARLWSALNRFAYRRAQHIVVLGRDMQRAIEQQAEPTSLPAISIIENWAERDAVSVRERATHPIIAELGAEDRFIVLYSGNIGRFHEIETVLDAAQRLDDGRFLFLFYGEGAQSKLVREAERSAKNGTVRLMPFQPRERLGLTLTGCDATLVTLRAGLSGLAVPSKLYGALASGKALVVVGPEDCEAALVAKEAGCGVVTPPSAGDKLATALTILHDDPALCARYGERARTVFEQKYDLERIADRWAQLLESINARGR